MQHKVTQKGNRGIDLSCSLMVWRLLPVGTDEHNSDCSSVCLRVLCTVAVSESEPDPADMKTMWWRSG